MSDIGLLFYIRIMNFVCVSRSWSARVLRNARGEAGKILRSCSRVWASRALKCICAAPSTPPLPQGSGRAPAPLKKHPGKVHSTQHPWLYKIVIMISYRFWKKSINNGNVLWAHELVRENMQWSWRVDDNSGSSSWSHLFLFILSGSSVIHSGKFISGLTYSNSWIFETI